VNYEPVVPAVGDRLTVVTDGEGRRRFDRTATVVDVQYRSRRCTYVYLSDGFVFNATYFGTAGDGWIVSKPTHPDSRTIQLAFPAGSSNAKAAS
jgi:hypothetical protein